MREKHDNKETLVIDMDTLTPPSQLKTDSSNRPDAATRFLTSDPTKK